ncbi:MAG: heavy metal translocating P-type ATPase [Verrucomicrobiaceae bacterium]
MNEQPCTHCHTLFLPSEQESEFCCSGCRFVNQLLLGEGLDDFYRLQGNQSGRPVGDRPFEKPQIDWLGGLITSLDPSKTQQSLTLRVSGVTCIGCVWLIERLFLEKKGAVRCSVFPASAEAEFTWETGSSAITDLAEELPRYGYLLEDPANVAAKKSESRKLIPRLGLCSAFAMNSMAFTLPRYLGMDESFPYAGLFELISFVSSTFALLIGGTYFFNKALAAIRHRSIHIDLPIALGLLAAYLGSIIGWLAGERHLIYFDFVATFTLLMLGGRYLHLAASERAQSQLQGQSAIPSTIQLEDGSQKQTEAIAPGDKLAIQPGQALPVAGRLLGDSGDFSLAWMTGEPDARTFAESATVPAGAIPVGANPVTISALESYPDSLVSRLTRQEARQESSPHLQTILKYYLLTIIILGITSGLTWIALGKAPLEALQTTISIFIVSCPCAIGVAIPLLDRRASAALARTGVFIQNPAIWPALTRIRHLIFDKTGTLTFETPEFTNPATLNTLPPEALKALQLLTIGSLHPLSRSLFQHLPHQEKSTSQNSPITNHPGLGSSLTVANHTWTLGKPGWLGKDSFTTEKTDSLSCELSRDGQLVARFHFRESLRPRAIQSFKNLGLSHSLHILSGDQSSRVTALAESLGIPANQSHGALAPEDKEKLVQQLSPSLYLGDGMNDTLAFAAATVSGTPVADRSLLDRTADFVFTCPGLSFLPTLFALARWRHHTAILILGFTILYNLAAISACVTGHMTPLVAAILMPASSVISLLIARRPIKTSPSNSHKAPSPISNLLTEQTS